MIIVRNQMKNIKSVALHNLGCKVNAYELDVLQQMLQENGWTIVPFDEKADVYLVNTCSVTNIADRKSRQMLHRAKKKNPDAIVVAMGCYVQTNEEEAVKDTQIDLLIGNNKKKDVLQILEQFMDDRATEKVQDKTLDHTTVIDINHTNEYEEMQYASTLAHTRAYVKIQDGCNQFCTYCIIPYARGRVRSRRLEDIVGEVTGLVGNGFQEVVLTGIHISSYGIDMEEPITLLELIETIHEIEGLQRIRLGSLEPRIVTEGFARRLSELSKICPHFHLSLQSGSDTVLKRMNRRYTTSEYYEKVMLLRKYMNYPAITTDIIVGFPGETMEEFQETLDYVNKIAFSEAHIFKYSKRKGTKASEMENQINDSVKAERSDALMACVTPHYNTFRHRLIGEEVEVLMEESKVIDGITYEIGHTREYCMVAMRSNVKLENQIVKGKVVRSLSHNIMEIQ